MPELFAPSAPLATTRVAPTTPVLPALGRRRPPSGLELIEIPRGYDPADPFVASFRVAAWIIGVAPDAARFEAALVDCRPTIDAVQRAHPALWERLRRLAGARRQALATAAGQVPA